MTSCFRDLVARIKYHRLPSLHHSPIFWKWEIMKTRSRLHQNAQNFQNLGLTPTMQGSGKKRGRFESHSLVPNLHAIQRKSSQGNPTALCKSESAKRQRRRRKTRGCFERDGNIFKFCRRFSWSYRRLLHHCKFRARILAAQGCQ